MFYVNCPRNKINRSFDPIKHVNHGFSFDFHTGNGILKVIICSGFISLIFTSEREPFRIYY